MYVCIYRLDIRRISDIKKIWKRRDLERHEIMMHFSVKLLSVFFFLRVPK